MSQVFGHSRVQRCRFHHRVRYIFLAWLSHPITHCLLASSSKSPDALLASLVDSGFPSSADAQEFAQEAFLLAPRKLKRPAAVQKQAQPVRQYGLLFDADMNSIQSPDRPRERSTKERRLRKRELDTNQWESDEDDSTRKRRKADSSASHEHPHSPPPDDTQLDIPEIEDTEARKERERIEDIKSRDELTERIRQRDLEKTKKIVEDRSSRASGPGAADAAARRQLADDAEGRAHALPSLRIHSRQEYLTKREIQQIELLRREIADDEVLFSGMKISKREQLELERKKELLRLVEERLNINDKWEGYQLPEDYFTEQGKIDKKKKENVLYQRYEEARRKDDQFVTDVDQWEASQTKHSTFKTGAMDKREVVDNYEYVFDESQTIKFVMDQTLKGEGMMSEKDRLLQRQIEEAEKRSRYHD